MSQNVEENFGAAKSNSHLRDVGKKTVDALQKSDTTEKLEVLPTQLRIHELSLEESGSSSVFKRQSSWKKFKESVKVTLTGWKGGGSGSAAGQEKKTETTEPEVVEGESAICKAREISERPTIPTRSKSLKVGRFKGATNFRSSMREPKPNESDIPTIVTTDFEGNLSTSIPRSPALAQKPLSDHLHASMPDISETSTEIQTESKLKEVPEISAEMLRQAIIDAARQKIRERSLNRPKQPQSLTDDVPTTQDNQESTGDIPPPKIYLELDTPESDENTPLPDEDRKVKRPILKEPLSMSNPDVSTDNHENAKLAVMKIRAAIASMTVQADFPTSSSQELSTDSLLSRRRLSGEKPSGPFLTPNPDQLAIRSSSVDFTLSPIQRRELLEVAAASSLETNKTWQSTTIMIKNRESLRRSSSLRRSESMKRNDSTKRKKARPMIWDHFDDVPNTALQGRCKVCHMTVSCKFNTGHFVRHLQLAHPSVYQSYQTKMQTNWTRSQLERSLK